MLVKGGAVASVYIALALSVPGLWHTAACQRFPYEQQALACVPQLYCVTVPLSTFTVRSCTKRVTCHKASSSKRNLSVSVILELRMTTLVSMERALHPDSVAKYETIVLANFDVLHVVPSQT